MNVDKGEKLAYILKQMQQLFFFVFGLLNVMFTYWFVINIVNVSYVNVRTVQ